MGMFDVSDETVAEYTEKFRSMCEERVDEPVVANAPFRRGGATTGMALSHAGLGAIPYAINSLFHKKRAGGLPQRVFLVATPTKLHAFKWDIRGRNYRLRDEVAVWDRAGLRISTEPKMGLTMLTIESPAEDEKVTLAPAGIKDDPWGTELIRVLREGVVEPPAAG